MKKHLFYAFLASLAVSSIFQFANTSLHDDGYFYSKMAQIFWRVGLVHDLPWIFFGTPHGSFSGNHFLFYILISPFTAIHPVLGLKAFSALAFALMCALFFYLLAKLTKPAYAYIGLATLMFGAADFFFRANLNRPLALVIALVLACVIFLQKKNWPAVAILSLTFVWLYDGYIILLPVVVIFLVNEYLQTKTFAWKLLAATVAGLGLGVLLHPYFPYNLTASHLSMILPFGHSGVMDSIEWQPYPFDRWESWANLIIVLFICSALLFWKSSQKVKKKTFFYFANSAFFFILLVFAHRFIDLFAPFAMIIFFQLIHPYLDRVSWADVKRKIFKDPSISMPAAILALIILGFYAFNMSIIVGTQIHETPADKFKPAAEFIAAHSQPGDIVTIVKWDQFPQMFFWNTQNYYTAGLNPVFMYARSKQLFWLYRHLQNDELLTCDQAECTENIKGAIKPEQAIKDRFQSRLLILDTKRNPKLGDYAQKSPGFTQIFSENDVRVYEVK